MICVSTFFLMILCAVVFLGLLFRPAQSYKLGEKIENKIKKKWETWMKNLS